MTLRYQGGNLSYGDRQMLVGLSMARPMRKMDPPRPLLGAGLPGYVVQTEGSHSLLNMAIMGVESTFSVYGVQVGGVNADWNGFAFRMMGMNVQRYVNDYLTRKKMAQVRVQTNQENQVIPTNLDPRIVQRIRDLGEESALMLVCFCYCIHLYTIGALHKDARSQHPWMQNRFMALARTVVGEEFMEGMSLLPFDQLIRLARIWRESTVGLEIVISQMAHLRGVDSVALSRGMNMVRNAVVTLHQTQMTNFKLAEELLQNWNCIYILILDKRERDSIIEMNKRLLKYPVIAYQAIVGTTDQDFSAQTFKTAASMQYGMKIRRGEATAANIQSVDADSELLAATVWLGQLPPQFQEWAAPPKSAAYYANHWKEFEDDKVRANNLLNAFSQLRNKNDLIEQVLPSTEVDQDQYDLSAI